MEHVKRAVLEGSGVEDGIDLDRDITRLTFDELGYDSLAVLETGLRLSREHDVDIPDTVFVDLETPQQLLDAVNIALKAQVAAV